MTSESEAVRRVLNALDISGIEYMIVGSYAASIHGFARATHDLDMVVSLNAEDVSGLADLLGDEFFYDVESARSAVERGDMFNAIHMDSGIKLDFWIAASDDFGLSQLSRRQLTDLEGIPAWVASAEDTILSKLLWYKITPSDRQLADAKGIVEVNSDRLDWDYLKAWSKTLRVEDLLAQIREK